MIFDVISSPVKILVSMLTMNKELKIIPILLQFVVEHSTRKTHFLLIIEIW